MFFARDPEKVLAKAQRLLAEGDPHAALDMVRKAQQRARPPVSGRLAELAEQARQALVHGAVARAEASAGQGLFADAAEWLRGGLEHADEAEREELADNLAAIEAAARRAAFAEMATTATPEPEEDPTVQSEAVAEPEVSDEDHLYEVYIGTLRPDLRQVYSDRPESFRRGVVAINQGDLHGEAAEALSAAAEADPDDAVLRLERGRLHHARGELEAALPDLAAAGDSLGVEPLDGATWSLSTAALWSEAALELDRSSEVLERLEGLGEVTMRDPYLSYLYAQALLGEDEREECERFLEESVSAFPQVTYLARYLAAVQRGRGAYDEAIAVLERTLDRSCAGGSCSTPGLEPETVRLLTGIYLDRGGDEERVDDLLQMLRGTQGGALPPEDWELVARHHEAVGDGDLASEAREHAERLRAEIEARNPPPVPAPA